MSSVKPPCLVRPLVLLTGDSLTQYSFDPDGGWGAALAHHFQRKADVINRGLSGYNTRWALEPFEQVMRQVKGQPVALLTIWFGANDAAIPGRGAERQHVPVPEYSANLASMVLKAREAGISNILLVTPPPVHDAGRVKHQQMKMGISTPVPPDRTLEHSQQYAAAVKEVGQQLHVPVVDMHSALQQTPNWQTELLADGLHFTPAGARAVWAALQPAINDNFSQLSLDSLSFQFPLWDKLDHANIEEYWQKTLPELQGAEAVQEAL